MIAHELTAFYGIDHARTLAIILPSAYNKKFDQKKMKSFKDKFVRGAIERGCDEKEAHSIWAKLERFSRYGIVWEQFGCSRPENLATGHESGIISVDATIQTEIHTSHPHSQYKRCST